MKGPEDGNNYDRQGRPVDSDKSDEQITIICLVGGSLPGEKREIPAKSAGISPLMRAQRPFQSVFVQKRANLRQLRTFLHTGAQMKTGHAFEHQTIQFFSHAWIIVLP